MALVLAACAGQPWLHEPAAEPEPAPAPEPVVAEERKPVPEKEKPTPEKEKPPLWEWNGNGRRISRIAVDLKSQQAHFYDGDESVGWTYVASGLQHYPTLSITHILNGRAAAPIW